jgi:2'-5' RNA ligase
MQRLFVGIALPPPFATRIEKAITPLKVQAPEIKWEISDNYHLTLKFLGQTEVSTLAIQQVLAPKLTRIKPFFMRLTDIGWLAGKLQTVVLTIEPVEELFQLFHITNNAMIELGFDQERRPFLPHVTLGRNKTKAILHLSKMTLSERFLVTHVTLFASKVTRSGAIYTSVVTAKLGKVEMT